MESSISLVQFGVQFINILALVPFLALLAPFLGWNCCKKDNLLKAERTHAPGQRPQTKRTNLDSSSLMSNSGGTGTSAISKTRTKSKAPTKPKSMKPKSLEKTPKEKEIAKGKLKNKNEYPTMDDVASDWGSADDGEKTANK